jgi:hypothetical protein
LFTHKREEEEEEEEEVASVGRRRGIEETGSRMRSKRMDVASRPA